MSASIGWYDVTFGLLQLLVLSGCASGDVPEVDCEAVEIKGYAEIAEAMSYCTECHGATRADEGIAYHTYALAKQHAERGQETIADGSMPEDRDMPEDLQTDFYVWTQCGMPE